MKLSSSAGVFAVLCIAAVTALSGCGGGGDGSQLDTEPTTLGAWSALAALPSPRQESASAVVGGRIYYPGGLNAGNEASATVEAYDTAANTWSTVPPLPEPRHHAGVAAANGKVYVLGGYTTGATPWRASGAVFEFDPAAGTWTRKADMLTPRGAHTAVALAGKIYCIGGVATEHGDGAHTGDEAVGTAEVFDPATNTWASLPPMPTPREHLAGAAVAGRIYVVGGRTGGDNRDEAEAFDPTTNAWESLPALPTARSGLAAAEMRGLLYVFGGEGFTPGPQVFSQAEQYNPATRSWRSLSGMRTPRHGMGATRVGGSIYLSGGGVSAGLAPSNSNEAFTLP